MPSRHPKPQDFEAFLEGAWAPGSAERNTRILRHFLADCSSCRESLGDLGWRRSRLNGLLQFPGASNGDGSVPLPSESWNYDRAFAKAEAAVSGFLAENPPPAAEPAALCGELSRLEPSERERLVVEDPRFAHVSVVLCLIDHGNRLRYQNPEETLQWADLARRAAEACTPESAGSELRLADVRARAWGNHGNALRICGRTLEAPEMLVTAHSYAAAGTGDPMLRARLLEQTASLSILQGRFQKALELNEEAGELYRELGEAQLLASCLVQRANICIAFGEPSSAVELLNRAVPLIDFEEEPQLLLAACHNLIRCYIDLDRPEQAIALYNEAMSLYREFDDALIQVRAVWQEGQLLRDLGHLRGAEAALARARQGFLDHGLAYEAAVVSLDLSSVYVKMGQTAAVKETVTAAIPIFRALRVDREILAALLQLRKLAAEEDKALDLIRLLNVQLAPLAKRKNPLR